MMICIINNRLYFVFKKDRNVKNKQELSYRESIKETIEKPLLKIAI